MARYRPAGEDPYVVRRRWLTNLGIGGMGVIGGGYFGFLAWFAFPSAIGVGVFCGFFAVVSGALAVGCFGELIVSADQAGVQFAIDERGIYFGRRPRGLVPWPHVAEIVLFEEHVPDSGPAPRLRFRLTAPSDLPEPGSETAGRTRMGEFDPMNHNAIRRALARFAPPHVQLTDLTR